MREHWTMRDIAEELDNISSDVKFFAWVINRTVNEPPSDDEALGAMRIVEHVARRIQELSDAIRAKINGKKAELSSNSILERLVENLKCHGVDRDVIAEALAETAEADILAADTR